MSDGPFAEASPDQQGEAHTEIGRFLAKRGTLLVKETRDIGMVETTYGRSLKVVSMIIGIAKSVHGEASCGLQLQQHDAEGDMQSSAFLDLDELPELSSALDYIREIASRMLNEDRDYTEITYSTKDSVNFGFYQDERNQQAYVQLQRHSDLCFVPVEDLRIVRELLDKGRAHLETRGGRVGQLLPGG